jgi:hypothetical protein
MGGEKSRCESAICTAVKIDLALIVLALVAALIRGVTLYTGSCPSTADGRVQVCSPLTGVLSQGIFSLVIYAFYYWWITIPVLVLPIILGLCIDLFGPKRTY